jgi:hypothetical protein
LSAIFGSTVDGISIETTHALSLNWLAKPTIPIKDTAFLSLNYTDYI